MPNVMKVTAQDFNQTSTGKKRGRPAGSKNKVIKVRAATSVTEVPSYKWECTCGKTQIMHIRCYSVTCKCKRAMTCTRKSGVLV